MTTIETTAFSAWQLPRQLKASHLDLDLVRSRASWIRNDLDPLVAREGPDILKSDNVITLIKFFDRLLTSQLTIETVRDSRIHFALLDLAGRATRWPAKLIDKAEEVVQAWEAKWGPLAQIRVDIYGPGGRLHSISTPEDLQKETLILKWQRKSDTPVAANLSRRRGDIGFTPGMWWINAMYAYHDGIIDNAHSRGGITAYRSEAYALLLTRNDEFNSTDPDYFTYRSRTGDAGRYCLTSAKINSRLPVRVLRSHNLRSFWAPRAGVRYDGLYKVSGWTVTQDTKTHKPLYDISFTRLPSEPPLLSILDHPSAEEMDDYHEYKYIRKEMRTQLNPLRPARPFNSLDRSAKDKSGSSDTAGSDPKSRDHGRVSLSPSAQVSPTTQNSPAADDNPFFSGALASQSGINRINAVRPDVIDYAPVINAASAAGASIDPFFVGALEERAGTIPVLHLDSPVARPVMDLDLEKAVNNSVLTDSARDITEKTGSRLSLSLDRRASRLIRKGKS